MTKRYISWWQLAALMVVNKLSMLTTYAPIVTAAPATRDAWLAALLAALIAFPLALVSYAMMRRFPGQSIFAVSRLVLGEWLGRLTNLAAAGLFGILAAVSIRQFAEVFVAAMMPETPLLAFVGMMSILAVLGAFAGFEVVARVAEVTAPIVVIGSILGPVLALGHMDFSRLLPILENGVRPLIEQTLTPILVFGEAGWTLYLAMPFLQQPRQAVRSLTVALAVNAVIVSLGAIGLVASMGPAMLDLEAFPTLTVTRMINIAEFITRVEWLIAGMWMGAMYVKLSLLFFAVSSALKETLGLPNYRWALLPVAIAASLGSQYVVQDVPELIEMFEFTRYMPAALPPTVGLPLLLLLVALLRGLGAGAGEGGNRGAQA